MVKDKGWYCMEELSPLKNEDLEMKFFYLGIGVVTEMNPLRMQMKVIQT